MNEAEKRELIDRIVRGVCELPGDRDPDDDETLILSVSELERILEIEL